MSPPSDIPLGPKLMALWPGGYVTRVMGDQSVVVGRADDCDLRIEEASVSRRHVVLHRAAGLVELEDLGSSNGTRVRGRRLASSERVALAPGDLVEIGKAIMFVQTANGRSDDAVAIAFSAFASTPTAPPPVLPAVPTLPPQPTARTSEMPMYVPRQSAPAVPEPDSVERLVDLVAASNLSVVLLGETGVGKEVTAQRIHARSPRHAGPFVRINCAALAETLLESELFGHERGAFTGAVKTKTGLLESGNGGTVLLDEIGEMPLNTQARLLRVLESREVLRVGSVEPRPIDVRIIAATNRDLPACVLAGTFRSDLYFRLNGITIRLPALRERRGEIVPLARLFLARSSPRGSITPEALVRLEAYEWPGNVRELRNVIERAVVLSGVTGSIDAVHLGFESLSLAQKPSLPPSIVPPSSGDLRADVHDFERKRIEQALEEAKGNQTRAASILGISRRTLVSRLDAYGMPRPRKKP